MPAGNPTSEDFSTTRCKIDYSAGATASIDIVTINRDIPDNPPFSGYYVAPIYWEIATNRIGFTADVSFKYTEAELGVANEGNLMVYSSPSGAAETWTVAGTSQLIDQNRNKITVFGLNTFSFFSIADTTTLVKDWELY